ncbi:MAG: response regulator [bacterium]|nr:response regulator [bacterium]
MKKILVVDDEPMVLRGISLILEQSHLDIDQILSAENGIEALFLIENEKPDLVLTDIRMPKLDGIELTRLISEQYPEVSVIIISGYDDFAYARKAIQYGVKDYILKPVQREELIQSVSSVIYQQTQKDRAYVSHRELDEILVLFVNWFSLQSKECLREGMEKVEKLFAELPASHRKKVASDMCSSLLYKVSMKLGCSLNVTPVLPKGDETEEWIAWFQTFLEDVAVQIRLHIEGEDYRQILLKMAKDYVEEHYNEEISLNEIAAKTGFSSSYFSQIFKENVGCSFVQYRTKLRIEKAMEMIAFSKKNITEIAMKIGYNDTSYFVRAFKEYTGMTPSQYKKKRNEKTAENEEMER